MRDEFVDMKLRQVDRADSRGSTAPAPAPGPAASDRYAAVKAEQLDRAERGRSNQGPAGFPMAAPVPEQVKQSFSTEYDRLPAPRRQQITRTAYVSVQSREYQFAVAARTEAARQIDQQITDLADTRGLNSPQVEQLRRRKDQLVNERVQQVVLDYRDTREATTSAQEYAKDPAAWSAVVDHYGLTAGTKPSPSVVKELVQFERQLDQRSLAAGSAAMSRLPDSATPADREAVRTAAATQVRMQGMYERGALRPPDGADPEVWIAQQAVLAGEVERVRQTATIKGLDPRQAVAQDEGLYRLSLDLVVIPQDIPPEVAAEQKERQVGYFREAVTLSNRLGLPMEQALPRIEKTHQLQERRLATQAGISGMIDSYNENTTAVMRGGEAIRGWVYGDGINHLDWAAEELGNVERHEQEYQQILLNAGPTLTPQQSERLTELETEINQGLDQTQERAALNIEHSMAQAQRYAPVESALYSTVYMASAVIPGGVAIGSLTRLLDDTSNGRIRVNGNVLETSADVILSMGVGAGNVLVGKFDPTKGGSSTLLRAGAAPVLEKGAVVLVEGTANGAWSGGMSVFEQWRSGQGIDWNRVGGDAATGFAGSAIGRTANLKPGAVRTGSDLFRNTVKESLVGFGSGVFIDGATQYASSGQVDFSQSLGTGLNSAVQSGVGSWAMGVGHRAQHRPEPPKPSGAAVGGAVVWEGDPGAFFEHANIDVSKLSMDELRAAPGSFTDLSTPAARKLLAAALIDPQHRGEYDFSRAYGDGAWASAVEAHEFLNGIPRDQLLERLTVDTLTEVNRLVFAPDTGWRAAVKRTLAELASGQPGAAGELRITDRRTSPAGLTPEEVQNIRASGVEVAQPWWAPGRQQLVYGDSAQVRPKLETILDQLKGDLSQPGADPIAAAARFQRDFVALHPFTDSNGRTSRLVMDRILAEYDLPPALLADPARDLSHSPEQWRDEVAAGVARSKAFLDVDQVVGGISQTLSAAAFPERFDPAQPLRPLAAGEAFIVGDQRFIVERTNPDGSMLITRPDEYGVLHRLHVDPGGEQVRKLEGRPIELLDDPGVSPQDQEAVARLERRGLLAPMSRRGIFAGFVPVGRGDQFKPAQLLEVLDRGFVPKRADDPEPPDAVKFRYGVKESAAVGVSDHMIFGTRNPLLSIRWSENTPFTPAATPAEKVGRFLSLLVKNATNPHYRPRYLSTEDRNLLRPPDADIALYGRRKDGSLVPLTRDDVRALDPDATLRVATEMLFDTRKLWGLTSPVALSPTHQEEIHYGSVRPEDIVSVTINLEPK